jgi:hypothetical protein
MQVDENRQHGGRPHYPSQQPRRTGLIIPGPKLKLLDQAREAMRLKHYSIRTEAQLPRLAPPVHPFPPHEVA